SWFSVNSQSWRDHTGALGLTTELTLNGMNASTPNESSTSWFATDEYALSALSSRTSWCSRVRASKPGSCGQSPSDVTRALVIACVTVPHMMCSFTHAC